ncbi:PucR family transcriptional regulator [Sporobacter termitidis]|nr:helix-turn-helix domain-containing protein [Sporobacter termitidis]
MDISLNIILDRISHYRYEAYVNLPSDTVFRRVSILSREPKDTQSDCLYVCRLSDALRVSGQGLYICVRDRLQDALETRDKLDGMIIINENLEPEQLFSEIQDTFVLINEWYQNMQDAVIRQKSIQDIITMSESVIGNFISVSDSALTLVAYTKNIPTDDPTSLFLIENGYHSDEAIRKFKVNKRFDAWMSANGLIVSTDGKISKYVVISKVFAFDETYFTHVVMTCNHREMTPGLIDLFSHMIRILSHYIRRNWEERKDYDHVYGSFVVDLMQGKIAGREAVAERAGIVGIRPEDEYIVLLLTGGGGDSAAFPGLLAHDIARRFPLFRSVYYNCRLILFLHHAELARYMAEQDMGNSLNAYFQENNVFCGMSDVFRDLLEFPSAYGQAELALEESGSVDRDGDIAWEPAPQYSNIARFDTYFATALLNKSEKYEKLWKSGRYGKMLIELARGDAEKNTNNLEVLYAYLTNERRATDTATALHMHRNNVVYRISRIEELLHISLDDTKTRLNLTVSFLMLRSSGLLREYKKYGVLFGSGE